MIRVLVVDDSASMRALISSVLSRSPAIELVGQAADPLEARTAIKALAPDVVTLDVEMPNMNGLDFLEKIMRLRPTPVIMVSTLTHRGADCALRALEIGAVDRVGKPMGALGDFDSLVEKVQTAAGARLRSSTERSQPAAAHAVDYEPGRSVVAIGSSTGGVEALISLLAGYPTNCPPPR